MDPEVTVSASRFALALAGMLMASGCAAAHQSFHPAWWYPGRHLQTIGGALRRAPRVPLRRTRWELPDGDFLDIDELPAPPEAPLLILLHGLESSSRTAHSLGMLEQAREQSWGGLAINFRSCSGEPNRLPRSYHGGETSDLAWVIDQVTKRDPARSILLVGMSLGGNVLLKYLGEQGDRVPGQVKAAVAVSAPFDLAASARALEHGFNRVYMSRLVKSLKQKTLAKRRQFPELVDYEAVRKVKTLEEFDDLVTGPVHGFADAEAYWAASSSKQFLSRIRRPTLLINARNDPFFPAVNLPRSEQVDNPFLTMEFPAAGGHLGFLSGRWPWKPHAWAERRTAEFLNEQIEETD